MWIASKLGFYSIVIKDGHIHVRARERGDLVNLVDSLPVEEWPAADYRYRVRVPFADDTDRAMIVQDLLLSFAETIDYDNFKSAIAREPSQRSKLSAYHCIWEEMARLQE